MTSGSHHYLLFSHQEYELPQVAGPLHLSARLPCRNQAFSFSKCFGLSLHSVAPRVLSPSFACGTQERLLLIMMEFNGIQPNPESMLKSRPKLCCIRPPFEQRSSTSAEWHTCCGIQRRLGQEQWDLTRGTLRGAKYLRAVNSILSV